MLAYLWAVGAKWLRMIVGPLATVAWIAQTIRPEGSWDVPVGPYDVNVWGALAVAMVFVAQYLLWKEEHQKREEADSTLRKDVALLDPLLPSEKRSEILKSLGEFQDQGRPYLNTIHRASIDLQRNWETFSAGNHSREEITEAWFDGRLTHDPMVEPYNWALMVSDYIGQYFNYSLVSRFMSDPVDLPTPPDSLTDEYYVKLWREHKMRLQRLQELIDELHRRWS